MSETNEDRRFTGREIAGWILQGDPDAKPFPSHHPMYELQERIVRGLWKYRTQELKIRESCKPLSR